ncbi:hypothetical protein GMNKNHGO_00097 [Enterococcus phage vB_Efa29212_3e]|uniref:Uncharacterized protein n=1 Tax=Enterococcus phage vB_Efa29212_3e TaxID=2982224 RepID=A0A978CTB9_9CAUD|nr:hypothetical protein GMNKNHGO_00097 [Enterococcus phage vB_Efa29212_3e]
MIDLEKLFNTILVVLTIIAVTYLIYVFYMAYVNAGWGGVALLMLFFVCLMIK